MTQLLNQVTNLLEECQPISRHSLFQLKYFVLGKEPTLQAKLRKCLNELDVRKNSLENMELSLEDLDDNVELLDLEIEQAERQKKETDDDLNKKGIDIQIRRKRRKRKSLENQISYLKQKKEECKVETEFFLNAFRSLEQIEKLKPFDDLEANAQLWNEKYTQMLNMTLLLQRPLDFEFVNCVLAMDKEMPIRKELINILDQIQAQSWKQKKVREQTDAEIESARIADSNVEQICQKESQV
jgi:hypothetical protein